MGDPADSIPHYEYNGWPISVTHFLLRVHWGSLWEFYGLVSIYPSRIWHPSHSLYLIGCGFYILANQLLSSSRFYYAFFVIGRSYWYLCFLCRRPATLMPRVSLGFWRFSRPVYSVGHYSWIYSFGNQDLLVPYHLWLYPSFVDGFYVWCLWFPI